MERIDKFKSEYQWPFNFFCALNARNPTIPYEGLLPSDFIATLDYILMTRIPAERRIEVISFYKDGKTSREIGAERGYSYQAVTQHIRDTIRKLCLPRNAKILSMGLKAYYEERMQIAAANGYRSGKIDGGYEARSQLKTETPIDNIGLSVRAYNCLKRAGYNTVGEVAAMSQDDISKVRNLGNRCCHEIYDRLSGRGLEINWSP